MIKAINNTTVEVTFPEEVDTDVKASDFSIDGLEIKNAAIKQSNKKAVVLTTASQTAEKEYVLSYKDEVIGGFKGVAAVIPTAVKMTEFQNPVVEKETTQVGSHKSQQAPLGTQVTLKAQVTVGEGQSKANIPVTFNIIDSSNKETAHASLNQPIIAEATTDENGVATYTYTRYASTAYELVTEDEVQVYATGNPTARDFSKVYWAAIQPLALTEVTEGNNLNNGAKKVYKVKLAGGSGQTVNVGFLDNVNVTPDKANKGVTVTDPTGKDLGYPGQFTTSSVDETNNKQVKITLDKKGEATFTLTGSSETVTPFVWVDRKGVNNTDPTVGRFDKTELVAFAPPVAFGKIQNMELTLTALGTSNAAAFKDGADAKIADKLGAQSAYTYSNDVVNSKITKTAASKLADDLENTGGRDYKAVLKDKAGKLAPSGTDVKVSVKSGSALTTTGPVYLVDNNTSTVYRLDSSKSEQEFTLKTDSKGEVSFTLIGKKDSYATPRALKNLHFLR
ncbi:hypothetical protein ACIQVU_20125 [Lysinibacillus sp. NPDC098008]|uniref:hypothetical protein n=1 Tax=Lysinibacillus sp. NPDC098008 TaxID=3364146 RepID=UPI00381C46E3